MNLSRLGIKFVGIRGSGNGMLTGNKEHADKGTLMPSAVINQNDF
jgi:hypothetical protein